MFSNVGYYAGTQAELMMSGRFIVLAIAAIGWLVAAVFAYAFITLFGFFGVGFYGLLVLFMCMQVELESQRSADRFSGARATHEMSRAERALLSLRQALGSTRFFKAVGIALAVIGFGGFFYFQLD